MGVSFTPLRNTPWPSFHIGDPAHFQLERLGSPRGQRRHFTFFCGQSCEVTNSFLDEDDGGREGGAPGRLTGINMTATKMSVLELIGWVALAALFVHDCIMLHPSIGLASLVGFLVGLMFDLRFSVLLVCLLLLAARRHKRNFPKEPTLKV
jgi:hypothetical protein